MSFGELPDDRAKWQAAAAVLAAIPFWLPMWGPKPNEPGCWAPPEAAANGLLTSSAASRNRPIRPYPLTRQADLGLDHDRVLGRDGPPARDTQR